MKIAIVTINNPSLNAAKELLPYLQEHRCDVYNKSEEHDSFIVFNKLDDILEDAWNNYDAIIFLLAIGAVIRKLSPFLKDKSSDPAILVMSLDLTKIIPLLSGHLGGANALAEELTQKIPNAINFVTTASDQVGRFAFDLFAKKHHFSISNLKNLAEVQNTILNGKKVAVLSYPAMFELLKGFKGYKEENFAFFLPYETPPHDMPKVYITPQHLNINTLQLHPRFTLGLGMNRDTSKEEIKEAVIRFCFEHSLEFGDIEKLASFEAKADEEGLLAFAKEEGFDLAFFSKDAINALEFDFSHSMATQFFGIKGVAEPASLLASNYKTLFINKRIYGNVTIAASF